MILPPHDLVKVGDGLPKGIEFSTTNYLFSLFDLILLFLMKNGYL
jgi:hypothetical protein